MSEKSPFFVEPKRLTRLDDLRERLDQLERILGKLGKMGPGAEPFKIPILLDQSFEVLEEVKKEGQQPKEEIARLEDITSQLRKRKALFLKVAGGPAAFQRARAGTNAGPERWWWYIDQAVAEDRKRQLTHFFRGAIVFAVVLLVLIFVYQRFFAPSPQEIARLNLQDHAQSLYTEGDPEGALRDVNQALAYAPGDPDLLVLKGIILQKLDRKTEADQVFAQAQSALGNQKDFLLMRAQKYLSSGEVDAAITDVKQVIQIDPNTPEAYLFLGQGYEYQQKYSEALDSYEQAVKLGDAQNKPALVALIKVRMAVLMQRIPGQ